MFVFPTARKRSRNLDILSVKIRFNQQQMSIWWILLFFDPGGQKTPHFQCLSHHHLYHQWYLCHWWYRWFCWNKDATFNFLNSAQH